MCLENVQLGPNSISKRKNFNCLSVASFEILASFVSGQSNFQGLAFLAPPFLAMQKGGNLNLIFSINFQKKSLFFSLMKRTKNQGFGIVVKAQISISCEISLRGALFCSLLNSLILSVIFCEATDKSLAFQFAIKTQQSRGHKVIWN